MKRPKNSARNARVRFQVPMHVGSQDQWFFLIQRGLQQLAHTVADTMPGIGDDPTREECFDRLRNIAPDEEQLMRGALSHHVGLFGEVARSEAGFDLRIEAQQIEIGGNKNWVFAFATMDAAAALELVQWPGVRETVARWSESRGKPRDFAGRRIDECDEEVLMDLLCAALPGATEVLAPSPELIVARFLTSPHFRVLCERNAIRKNKEKARREPRTGKQRTSTTRPLTLH